MTSLLRHLLTQRNAAVVFALIATLGHLGAGEATLAPSTPAVREELAVVVRAQVAAFAAKDFAGALKFASEKFRAQYDAASFEALVRKNYAALVVAKSCAPLDASNRDTEAALNVRAVDARDAATYFRYFFIREDGAWKIVGVIPIPPPATVAA